MHVEARQWCENVRAIYPQYFINKDVIEYGAYDINGSVRNLFSHCRFTGVDWRAGPGVNVVSLAHEYHHPFRVGMCLCTEMLEHDPFWKMSLETMFSQLILNGAILITCAGPGRKAHCNETAPNNYYGNVSVGEMYELVKDWKFELLWLAEDKSSHDTYMWMIK